MKLLAYIEQYSFLSNDTINLYISGNKDNCNINIISFFNKDKVYSGVCDISLQNIPELGYAEGFDWNISKKINITEMTTNKPDLYIIECSQKNKDNINNTFYIPFIILNNKEPNDILVILNTNTWQAYEQSGGASYYNFTEECKNKKNKYIRNSNGLNSYREGSLNVTAVVSYNRPLTTVSTEIGYLIDDHYKPSPGSGTHHFFGEKYLWLWLLKNNFKFDMITDSDVENMEYMKNRKIIMLNCHPEYWSHEMYFNLLKSVEIYKTNIIYLGGNAIWRKVYINKDKNRMEKMGCPILNRNNVLNNYKNPYSIDTFAAHHKINIEPFVILGMYYYWGFGSPDYENFYCINNDSWVFKNTIIKNGDVIGLNYDTYKPSGNETDIVNHPWLTEALRIKYFKNTKILGKANNIKNGGEIILHEYKKSKIFSVGAIPATRCIDDPEFTIMLKNVITKFIL